MEYLSVAHHRDGSGAHSCSDCLVSFPKSEAALCVDSDESVLEGWVNVGALKDEDFYDGQRVRFHVSMATLRALQRHLLSALRVSFQSQES